MENIRVPNPGLSEEELKKYHGEMLEHQKEIAPFIPSLNEMSKVWYLSGNHAVTNRLRAFYARGWVVTRPYGGGLQYYAIPIQENEYD